MLPAGLVVCDSWLALGTMVSDVWGAAAAVTVGSASVAFSDVVVDSLVVAQSREISSSSGSESSTARGGDI